MIGSIVKNIPVVGGLLGGASGSASTSSSSTSASPGAGAGRGTELSGFLNKADDAMNSITMQSMKDSLDAAEEDRLGKKVAKSNELRSTVSF